MTVEKKLSAPKRRTRAEVQQLVAEFVNSGMRRSEFCRSRSLSLGTLNRHLYRVRGNVALPLPRSLSWSDSSARMCVTPAIYALSITLVYYFQHSLEQEQ